MYSFVIQEFFASGTQTGTISEINAQDTRFTDSSRKP
jgi:hypothetical protein